MLAPSRRQDFPQLNLHKAWLSEVPGSLTALTALILVGGQPQLLVALVVADWQAALLQVSGEGLLLAALFVAGLQAALLRVPGEELRLTSKFLMFLGKDCGICLVGGQPQGSPFLPPTTSQAALLQG